MPKPTWVNQYRTRLFFHVMCNLVLRTSSQVQGPIAVQAKYVTPWVKTIVGDMLNEDAKEEGYSTRSRTWWRGVVWVSWR